MSGAEPAGPGAATAPVASGLETLLPRLRPQLRAILNTWRIPPADSEDLVQATLTIAVEKWQHIDKPEPWILATLRHRCAFYRREHRRRDPLHVEIEAEADDGTEPAEAILPPVPPEQERRKALLDLQRLARDLPAPERHLLGLRHHLGLTGPQAAAATGYAPASMPKRTGRAVANLRRAHQRAQAAARAWAEALAGAPERPIPWKVGAAAFAATRRGRGTAGHLAAAGALLGAPPLGSLTLAALRALHGEVRRRDRTERLAAVHRFLEWAGELGAHALEREPLRRALGPDEGVAHQAAPSARRPALATMPPLAAPLPRVRVPAALAVPTARPMSWDEAISAYLHVQPAFVRRAAAPHLRAARFSLRSRTLGALSLDHLDRHRRRLLAQVAQAGRVAGQRSGKVEEQQAAGGAPRKTAGGAPAEQATAALTALRRFLLWAGHRRLHALRPNAVCQALRPPAPSAAPAPFAPLTPPAGSAPPAAALVQAVKQSPAAAAGQSSTGTTQTAVAAGTILAGLTVAMTRFLAHLHRCLHNLEAAGAPHVHQPPARHAAPAASPSALPPHHAWDEAVEVFLATADYADSTRTSYRRALRQAGEHLGAVPLASLKERHLTDFRSHLAATGASNEPVTLAALRSFLRWCGERGVHGLADIEIRTALLRPADTGRPGAARRGRPRS